MLRKVLGVVHVLMASKTAEHGLPQKPHRPLAGVFAAPHVQENFSSQLGQAERVIELAVGNTLLNLMDDPARDVTKTAL